MDSNHRCLDVGQESSPLDHGIKKVAEVGIEPTIDHQALDLAALPRLRTRPSKLRRPDSNRRRTAYETVLETRLQSTPQ